MCALVSYKYSSGESEEEDGDETKTNHAHLYTGANLEGFDGETRTVDVSSDEVLSGVQETACSHSKADQALDYDANVGVAIKVDLTKTAMRFNGPTSQSLMELDVQGQVKCCDKNEFGAVDSRRKTVGRTEGIVSEEFIPSDGTVTSKIGERFEEGGYVEDERFEGGGCKEDEEGGGCKEDEEGGGCKEDEEGGGCKEDEEGGGIMCVEGGGCDESRGDEDGGIKCVDDGDYAEGGEIKCVEGGGCDESRGDEDGGIKGIEGGGYEESGEVKCIDGGGCKESKGDKESGEIKCVEDRSEESRRDEDVRIKCVEGGGYEESGEIICVDGGDCEENKGEGEIKWVEGGGCEEGGEIKCVESGKNDQDGGHEGSCDEGRKCVQYEESKCSRGEGWADSRLNAVEKDASKEEVHATSTQSRPSMQGTTEPFCSNSIEVPGRQVPLQPNSYTRRHWKNGNKWSVIPTEPSTNEISEQHLQQQQQHHLDQNEIGQQQQQHHLDQNEIGQQLQQHHLDQNEIGQQQQQLQKKEGQKRLKEDQKQQEYSMDAEQEVDYYGENRSKQESYEYENGQYYYSQQEYQEYYEGYDSWNQQHLDPNHQHGTQEHCLDPTQQHGIQYGTQDQPYVDPNQHGTLDPDQQYVELNYQHGGWDPNQQYVDPNLHSIQDHQYLDPNQQRAVQDQPYVDANQLCKDPNEQPGTLDQQYSSQDPQYSSQDQQYSSQDQQYVDLNQQYENQCQHYVEPNQLYEDPNHQYEDPNHQYEDPNQQYEDPNQQYDDPNLQYDDPNQQYVDPNQQYVAQGRQYGSWNQGFGASSERHPQGQYQYYSEEQHYEQTEYEGDYHQGQGQYAVADQGYHEEGYNTLYSPSALNSHPSSTHPVPKLTQVAELPGLSKPSPKLTLHSETRPNPPVPLQKAYSSVPQLTRGAQLPGPPNPPPQPTYHPEPRPNPSVPSQQAYSVPQSKPGALQPVDAPSNPPLQSPLSYHLPKPQLNLLLPSQTPVQDQPPVPSKLPPKPLFPPGQPYSSAAALNPSLPPSKQPYHPVPLNKSQIPAQQLYSPASQPQSLPVVQLPPPPVSVPSHQPPATHQGSHASYDSGSMHGRMSRTDSRARSSHYSEKWQNRRQPSDQSDILPHSNSRDRTVDKWDSHSQRGRELQLARRDGHSWCNERGKRSIGIQDEKSCHTQSESATNQSSSHGFSRRSSEVISKDPRLIRIDSRTSSSDSQQHRSKSAKYAAGLKSSFIEKRNSMFIQAEKAGKGPVVQPHIEEFPTKKKGVKISSVLIANNPGDPSSGSKKPLSSFKIPKRKAAVVDPVPSLAEIVIPARDYKKGDKMKEAKPEEGNKKTAMKEGTSEKHLLKETAEEPKNTESTYLTVKKTASAPGSCKEIVVTSILPQSCTSKEVASDFSNQPTPVAGTLLTDRHTFSEPTQPDIPTSTGTSKKEVSASPATKVSQTKQSTSKMSRTMQPTSMNYNSSAAAAISLSHAAASSACLIKSTTTISSTSTACLTKSTATISSTSTSTTALRPSGRKLSGKKAYKKQGAAATTTSADTSQSGNLSSLLLKLDPVVLECLAATIQNTLNTSVIKVPSTSSSINTSATTATSSTSIIAAAAAQIFATLRPSTLAASSTTTVSTTPQAAIATCSVNSNSTGAASAVSFSSPNVIASSSVSSQVFSAVTLTAMSSSMDIKVSVPSSLTTTTTTTTTTTAAAAATTAATAAATTTTTAVATTTASTTTAASATITTTAASAAITTTTTVTAAATTTTATASTSTATTTSVIAKSLGHSALSVASSGTGTGRVVVTIVHNNDSSKSSPVEAAAKTMPSLISASHPLFVDVTMKKNHGKILGSVLSGGSNLENAMAVTSLRCHHSGYGKVRRGGTPVPCISTGVDAGDVAGKEAAVQEGKPASITDTDNKPAPELEGCNDTSMSDVLVDGNYHVIFKDYNLRCGKSLTSSPRPMEMNNQKPDICKKSGSNASNKRRRSDDWVDEQTAEKKKKVEDSQGIEKDLVELALQEEEGEKKKGDLVELALQEEEGEKKKENLVELALQEEEGEKKKGNRGRPTKSSSIKRKLSVSQSVKSRNMQQVSATKKTKRNDASVGCLTVCALCLRRDSEVNLGFLYGPYKPQVDERETGGKDGSKNHDDEDGGGVEQSCSSLWVHEDCAVWAPGVCLVGGSLLGLHDAVADGVKLVCRSCKAVGATLCCHYRTCKAVYHYPCARDTGCSFKEERLLISCPKHKLPS